MTSFALYRLPRQRQVTLVEQTEGQPLECLSCAELDGQSGFALAPFVMTEKQPLLVIRADSMTTFADEQHVAFTHAACADSHGCHPAQQSAADTPRKNYAIDFANFHAQLTTDVFRKIVLARCAEEPRATAEDPITLFRRACSLYPRLFVALVFTPKSGLWLTATPEILLERTADHWRTIALAGTMRLEGSDLEGEGENIRWSPKNIQEQRLVATYITECLEHFVNDFSEEGPYTVRAANLVHLRSDFTFTIGSDKHIGQLLQALHPTPAVCGLPKRSAYRFIIDNEQVPRQYYSGFMGPFNLPAAETHLFVSLRCMQITADKFRMYAGGGLLKDSTEVQEWQETEAKLGTMRRLLTP